jgi:DNA modification methylase
MTFSRIHSNIPTHLPLFASLDMTMADPHGILNLFGREILNMPFKKREVFINRAFEYWRKCRFPYPYLSTKEIKNEYYKVKNVNIDNVLDGNMIKSSMIGLRLANYFHPQMWHLTAHNHKKSPVDHFNDDETLLKLLRKAFKFWPNRRCWNSQCLRSLLRIYSGGRVANFRPTAAKVIIDLFSNIGDTILDFCSGFGGRLLGALALNRHYIGIDPSTHQVGGLNMMYQKLKLYIKGTSEIHCDCAEDLMPHLDSESIDLIFTSPPYYNVERYCFEMNQSSHRYRTYNEWRKEFLRVVIFESKRLLRPKGYFIINVANTYNYSIADDVKQIASSLFAFHSIVYLSMNAMPAHRVGGNKMYRCEPILIFQKAR